MPKLTLEESLAKNGFLTYRIRGVSMQPMLRQGRDLFTVVPKGSERCKKYDVVLYRRPSDPYVLHRIIEVRPDSYVILGDNCIAKEYGMLVRLLGAVTAILWLEPRFLYILLPGGAAMMLLTYAFRKILKRLHKKIQETDGALRVFLQERLESLVIVRTFAKEEQMTRQADALMDAHKAARMKRSNFSNLCNIGFAGAMDGAYLLGIGFCGYGILTGTMSYGNLMAIMQLVGQVQSPFANLTGYLPRYYSMLASAERLMEAEAFAPDSTETVPEEQTLNFYQTELQSLQLEHVCFTYQPPVQTEGEPPAMPVVLQDVSLTVRKGEYVVFTGPSGCGKSTLLKLLMCLYPLDSGQRFLSTKNGNQPLTPAWKSLFAYVPQGNQLLSGSIRSIVAFGDEDRAQDENAIYNALKIACADDFVRRLENGLDTVLGERGAGLSEGQIITLTFCSRFFTNYDKPIFAY